MWSAQLLRLLSTKHRREGSIEESSIREVVVHDSESRIAGAGGMKFPICVGVSWFVEAVI